MRCSSTTDTEKADAAVDSPLAKMLAPEDVRAGDYVTLLHVTYQVPSWFWCADSTLLPPDEPIRIRYLAPEGGLPLKVRSVCLPFVLIESAVGQSCALDLRQCSVARLRKPYARAAWKALKKNKKLAKSGHAK
jgi:hypothetical protein